MVSAYCAGLKPLTGAASVRAAAAEEAADDADDTDDTGGLDGVDVAAFDGEEMVVDEVVDALAPLPCAAVQELVTRPAATTAASTRIPRSDISMG